MPVVESRVTALLQCPLSGSDLRIDGETLVAVRGGHRYPITKSGIPMFGGAYLSSDGAVQQKHYDALAPRYLDNLEYPHTQEYMAYLDRAVLDALPRGSLGTVAEICCGAGDGLRLLGSRAGCGIGIDVSMPMLEAAVQSAAGDQTRAFVQGDATRLPLKSGQFDSVVMLGGIHHVNDRQTLFGEVARVMKPGGLFVFREPVDDFVVWRALRAIVYRTASSLQADTEHPLRFRETAGAIAGAGLVLESWRTYGFAAYCFLMNSDVLPINRFWQYVPGIRGLTRAAARFDEGTLRIPGLAGTGLVVIATATKPSMA